MDTLEQQARDLLDRLGVDDAQSWSAGDIVELANLMGCQQEIEALKKKNEEMSTWKSMDTAPKGGGAALVTDPNWIHPPKILLLFEGGDVSVGYWELYYAVGGGGYDGIDAWVEPISGERLALEYDPPVKWMPIP